MRFLPWLKAYRCASCGKVQLASEQEVHRALAARATNELYAARENASHRIRR